MENSLNSFIHAEVCIKVFNSLRLNELKQKWIKISINSKRSTTFSLLYISKRFQFAMNRCMCMCQWQKVVEFFFYSLHLSLSLSRPLSILCFYLLNILQKSFIKWNSSYTERKWIFCVKNKLLKFNNHVSLCSVGFV